MRRSAGFWLLVPLLQMWALIAWLWAPPGTPVGTQGRVLLRIAAAVIAIVAISAGVLFSKFTFAEADPWGRMMNGAVSFGIFGLPTSFAALLIAAVVAKAKASQDAVNSAAAVLMAVSFFGQWLILAAALLRRSLVVAR